MDDCFTGEPVETVQSAFDCIKYVCTVLGFCLEPAKESPPSTEANVLGAKIALSEYDIEVSLPERKRQTIAAELATVLQRRRLSPADAGKLRGRLGFAQSFLFGKFGRAHLGPFTARQYAIGNATALNPDLFEVLPWWINMLNCSIPRRLSCFRGHPIVVYCDACGEGHLGVKVFDGSQCWTAHTHVPRWMQNLHINVKEMAGAVYALCVDVEVSQKRQILLCCDNTGARGMVIRGHSKNHIGRGPR